MAEIWATFRNCTTHKICSRHFNDSDFNITYPDRKLLKPGSVPSVFNRRNNRRWKIDQNSLKTVASHELPSTVTTAATEMDQSGTPGSLPEPMNDNSMVLLHTRIAYRETQLKREKAQSEIHRKERDHVSVFCTWCSSCNNGETC